MENKKALYILLAALIALGSGCTRHKAGTDRDKLKESQKVAAEKKDQYRMAEIFENDKTQIIDLMEGPATFDIKYDGNSTFTCRLLNNLGDIVDILADNRQGPFKDTKSITVPKTSSYILDVKTTGSWSVYRK
jgi:hypothetical protein